MLESKENIVSVFFFPCSFRNHLSAVDNVLTGRQQAALETRMTLDFKLEAVEDRKMNNHIQILSVIAYLRNVINFFLQVKD